MILLCIALLPSVASSQHFGLEKPFNFEVVCRQSASVKSLGDRQHLRQSCSWMILTFIHSHTYLPKRRGVMFDPSATPQQQNSQHAKNQMGVYDVRGTLRGSTLQGDPTIWGVYIRGLLFS